MKLFFFILVLGLVILTGCDSPPSERFSQLPPSKLILQFDGICGKYSRKYGIRRSIVNPDTIALIWDGLFELKKGSQSYFLRRVCWRINILNSDNKVETELLHYDASYFNFRVGRYYYQNDSLYLLLKELMAVDELAKYPLIPPMSTE